MNRSRFHLLWLAAFLLTSLTISLSYLKAQDDLFGDDVFSDDEPIADESSEPLFGDEPDAVDFDDAMDAALGDPPEAAQPDDASDEETVVDSAVVQAIRMRDPKTATDLLRAVDQLIRLERFDLASDYLAELAASDLDDIEMTRLQQEYGTAVFLRLTRSAELAPLGGQFARRVLRAARRVSLDPQRLEAWAKQLGDEQRIKRFEAGVQLLRAGGDAVEPIVAAVVKAESESILPRMGLTVLRQIGIDAVEPLIGQLSSSQPQRRVFAIQALGQIEAREALPYLLGSAFAPVGGNAESQSAQQAIQAITGRWASRTDAVEILRRGSDRAYRGLSKERPDGDDQVVRWTWSPTSKRVRRVMLRSADASALAASRLYRQLLRLEPQNVKYQTRFLISRLDVDQGVAGLDEPLRTNPGSAYAQTKAAGASVANRVLRTALADRHFVAAIGAARVLGDLNQRHVLSRTINANELVSAPLVEALAAPDARVRFAAAKAIIELQPPLSFDGASRLADTLTYFATTVGQPAVIVAHPRRRIASELAGILGQYGYASVVVGNSRDLLKTAYQWPDLQLAMVSDSLNDESAWDTLEQLRVHPRTAKLPIALLARPDRVVQDQRLSLQFDDVTVLPESLDREALMEQLPQIVRRLNRDRIPPAERLRRAQLALRWLADWMARTDSLPGSSSGGRSRAMVDWRRLEPQLTAALQVADLREPALRVISQIGSATAQTQLVDIASEQGRDLAERQAAGKAFADSVARFGVLLSRQQIVQQYERYNSSRVLDRATQVLLGSVLDTIEARTQAGPEWNDVSKL